MAHLAGARHLYLLADLAGNRVADRFLDFAALALGHVDADFPGDGLALLAGNLDALLLVLDKASLLLDRLAFLDLVANFRGDIAAHFMGNEVALLPAVGI